MLCHRVTSATSVSKWNTVPVSPLPVAIQCHKIQVFLNAYIPFLEPVSVLIGYTLIHSF